MLNYSQIFSQLVRISLFAVIGLLATQTTAQDITGKWNGQLQVMGTQLRLSFNISEVDTGYTATMDSPDQNAFGIPVPETSFQDSVLTLSIPSATISYSGKLNADNEISGEFKQMGRGFPLDLSREKIEKNVVNRPQEPKPPFPYRSENITFDNQDADITLAGTLTLPEGKGPFETVILISGSGPQDRNEEILEHKPFLVISDHLTRNGFAVLRYDDRGVGESEGVHATGTSADLATDVESAVRYLKGRKEVQSIGLMGHSEGGILAAMVAARSKDVDFVVLMAGSAVPGMEILLRQQELIARKAGATDDQIEKSLALNRKIMETVIATPAEEDPTPKVVEIMDNDPMVQVPQGADRETYLTQQAQSYTSTWVRYFLAYDPAEDLRKIKQPVLVLFGGLDLQVDPDQNLKPMQDALAGNREAQIIIIREHNHLFQAAETGMVAEYGEIEQTISPLVLKTVTDWLRGL